MLCIFKATLGRANDDDEEGDEADASEEDIEFPEVELTAATLGEILRKSLDTSKRLDGAQCFTKVASGIPSNLSFAHPPAFTTSRPTHPLK